MEFVGTTKSESIHSIIDFKELFLDAENNINEAAGELFKIQDQISKYLLDATDKYWTTFLTQQVVSKQKIFISPWRVLEVFHLNQR